MNKHIHNKIKAAMVVAHRIEQRAVLLLLAVAVLLAGLYMYFVASAVVHAVVRKDVQDIIAQKHSEVAELEVAYLARKNEITTTRAEELGFTRIAQKSYVERARYIGRADTDQGNF